MTLNGVMARYLAFSPNSVVSEPTMSNYLKLGLHCRQRKCSAKNLVFGNTIYVLQFPRVLNNNALKRGIPHSKATIRLVQHCAAVSATAEVFLRLSNGTHGGMCETEKVQGECSDPHWTHDVQRRSADTCLRVSFCRQLPINHEVCLFNHTTICSLKTRIITLVMSEATKCHDAQ